MTFDPHRNLAWTTVRVPPVPAGSGLSLDVEAGQGGLFPDPAVEGAYNLTVFPAEASQTAANTEIVRVTARSGDTLTIKRAQEASMVRPIQVGDRVELAITKKTITDIEQATAAGTAGLTSYVLFLDAGSYRVRNQNTGGLLNDVGYAGWGSAVTAVEADSAGAPVDLLVSKRGGLVPPDTTPVWKTGRTAMFRIRGEMPQNAGLKLGTAAKTLFSITDGVIGAHRYYDFLTLEDLTIDADEANWATRGQNAVVGGYRRFYVGFRHIRLWNLYLKNALPPDPAHPNAGIHWFDFAALMTNPQEATRIYSHDIQIAHIHGDPVTGIMGGLGFVHVAGALQNATSGGLIGANSLVDDFHLYDFHCSFGPAAPTATIHSHGVFLGAHGWVGEDVSVQDGVFENIPDVAIEPDNPVRFYARNVTAIDCGSLLANVFQGQLPEKQGCQEWIWDHCHVVRRNRLQKHGFRVNWGNKAGGPCPDMGTIRYVGCTMNDYVSGAPNQRPIGLKIDGGATPDLIEIELSGRHTRWSFDKASTSQAQQIGTLIEIGAGTTAKRTRVLVKLDAKVRGTVTDSGGGTGSVTYALIRATQGAHFDLAVERFGIDAVFSGLGLDANAFKPIFYGKGAKGEETLFLINAGGGHWKAGVGGQLTGLLSFDSSVTDAAAMKTALEALSTVGSGNVVSVDTGGDDADFEWDVVFDQSLGALTVTAQTVDLTADSEGNLDWQAKRIHAGNASPDIRGGVRGVDVVQIVGAPVTRMEDWNDNVVTSGRYTRENWAIDNLPADALIANYQGARPEQIVDRVPPEDPTPFLLAMIGA